MAKTSRVVFVSQRCNHFTIAVIVIYWV